MVPFSIFELPLTSTCVVHSPQMRISLTQLGTLL